MEVVVLGSGTAVPVPDRFPAGYLVRSDGTNTLVDLGPGVLRRVGQLGIGLEAISSVLLTHYHTDHCADIAALLFALRNSRYAGRPRLRLRGAKGLHALLERITAAWPWCRAEGYELDVEEIEPGTFSLDSMAITAVAIEHTDASLGYRIETPDGCTAAFSGDATFCDGVIEVARQTRFFVCDSAFPTAHPVPGHMTASEAGRVAAAAGVETLCLTHFYPECDGYDLVAEAAAVFDGEVLLARDLFAFDVASGRYAAAD